MGSVMDAADNARTEGEAGGWQVGFTAPVSRSAKPLTLSHTHLQHTRGGNLPFGWSACSMGPEGGADALAFVRGASEFA